MERYEQVKILGRGSFGTALLVRDRSLGKGGPLLVIKEIDMSRMPAKSQQEALAEVSVLRRLSHVNIVAYIAAFTEAARLHIVMEFADAGDLASAIDKRRRAARRFGQDEVLDIFAQCCQALHHTHGKHILHRDLKCQNIFLTSTGTVKLGDFGIARVLDHTGAVAMTQIGTPTYLPPEVCDNRPYGTKADMWALGIVLYELMALEQPFKAQNISALFYRILTADPDPLPTEYSLQMRSLALLMLAKKPEDRPGAGEVLGMPMVKYFLACAGGGKFSSAPAAPVVAVAAPPLPPSPSSSSVPRTPARKLQRPRTLEEDSSNPGAARRRRQEEESGLAAPAVGRRLDRAGSSPPTAPVVRSPVRRKGSVGASGADARLDSEGAGRRQVTFQSGSGRAAGGLDDVYAPPASSHEVRGAAPARRSADAAASAVLAADLEEEAEKLLGQAELMGRTDWSDMSEEEKDKTMLPGSTTAIMLRAQAAAEAEALAMELAAEEDDAMEAEEAVRRRLLEVSPNADPPSDEEDGEEARNVMRASLLDVLERPQALRLEAAVPQAARRRRQASEGARLPVGRRSIDAGYDETRRRLLGERGSGASPAIPSQELPTTPSSSSSRPRQRPPRRGDASNEGTPGSAGQLLEDTPSAGAASPAAAELAAMAMPPSPASSRADDLLYMRKLRQKQSGRGLLMNDDDDAGAPPPSPQRSSSRGGGGAGRGAAEQQQPPTPVRRRRSSSLACPPLDLEDSPAIGEALSPGSGGAGGSNDWAYLVPPSPFDWHPGCGAAPPPTGVWRLPHHRVDLVASCDSTATSRAPTPPLPMMRPNGLDEQAQWPLQHTRPMGRAPAVEGTGLPPHSVADCLVHGENDSTAPSGPAQTRRTAEHQRWQALQQAANQARMDRKRVIQKMSDLHHSNAECMREGGSPALGAAARRLQDQSPTDEAQAWRALLAGARGVADGEPRGGSAAGGAARRRWTAAAEATAAAAAAAAAAGRAPTAEDWRRRPLC